MKEVRKFLRRYKELVSYILIILFVILGFVIGIIPFFKKVVAQRQEVGALRTLTQELSDKAAILDGIDEVAYQKILTDLIIAVPADQSLTSLFSTIDGLAFQTGIAVTEMGLENPGVLATSSARPQSVEEKKVGTNLLPFAVTVSGRYDQIQEFLVRAVKVRRFFQVRGFTLALIDPTNVSVRMTMDAFYAPYLTSLGGVDTKIEPLSQTDEQIISTVASLPIVADQSLIDPSALSGAAAVVKADPFSP